MRVPTQSHAATDAADSVSLRRVSVSISGGSGGNPGRPAAVTVFVNVGHKTSLQNNPTWTFTGWVNPESFSSSGDRWLMYKDRVLRWGFLSARPQQPSVEIGTGSGGSPWQGAVTSSALMHSNTWVHLAVTYTNSQVRFYVNGALTDTISKTYTMGSRNSAFSISTSGESFHGKLDDMRYYNRALSAAEIAATYGESVTNQVYLADALGSIVALADAGQTNVTRYAYEPFGLSTVNGQPSTNPYTFTGREGDGTGLMYYRARYYHPVLGRFVSEDPIEYGGGDINLYSYVGNSVMNFVDPLGLAPGDWWDPRSYKDTLDMLRRKAFTDDYWASDEIYNSAVDEAGTFLYCNGGGASPLAGERFWRRPLGLLELAGGVAVYVHAGRVASGNLSGATKAAALGNYLLVSGSYQLIQGKAFPLSPWAFLSHPIASHPFSVPSTNGLGDCDPCR